MAKQIKAPFYTVRLHEDLSIDLPLVTFPSGFQIYSFDMLGKARWNQLAAVSLKEKLKGYGFSIFITAEAKAIGLVQELSRQFDHDDYVVFRKSQKPYMTDPISVDVLSITTDRQQKFWLGKESFSHLKGQTVCLADDVVSTGGTIDAFLTLAEEVGFTIGVIACALTEGEKRSHYKGIPLVTLDHFPLP